LIHNAVVPAWVPSSVWNDQSGTFARLANQTGWTFFPFAQPR
jgi:hypothetical protein